MAKYWDITRRRKERKNTPSVEKKRKLNASWLFFLCLIGAFFLAFAGISKMPHLNLNQSAISTPSSIKNDGSSLTKSNLKIKLINGTGLFEDLTKFKTTLAQNGYNIKISENALNIYPNSIIYYEKQAKSYASDLAKLFQNYKPKITELSQDTDYDIIIVIGKN